MLQQDATSRIKWRIMLQQDTVGCSRKEVYCRNKSYEKESDAAK